MEDKGEALIRTNSVEIAFQPFDGSLSPKLERLAHGLHRPCSLRITVAYSSVRGILTLEPTIKAVMKKGRVLVAVGLHEKRTTYEALNSLLHLNVPTYVVQDTRPNHRFHQKVYEFSDSGKGTVVLGSNNLTESGIMSNYEASARVTFDLSNNADRRAFARFTKRMNRYFTKSSWVKILNQPLLKKLKKLGLVVNESRPLRSYGRRSETERAAKIFGPGPDLERTAAGYPLTSQGSRLGFTLTGWDCRPQCEIQVPTEAATFFPSTRRKAQTHLQVQIRLPNNRVVSENTIWWHRRHQHQYRLRSPGLVRSSRARAGDIVVMELVRRTRNYRAWLVRRRSKQYSRLLPRLTEVTRGKKWGFLSLD